MKEALHIPPTPRLFEPQATRSDHDYLVHMGQFLLQEYDQSQPEDSVLPRFSGIENCTGSCVQLAFADTTSPFAGIEFKMAAVPIGGELFFINQTVFHLQGFTPDDVYVHREGIVRAFKQLDVPIVHIRNDTELWLQFVHGRECSALIDIHAPIINATSGETAYRSEVWMSYHVPEMEYQEFDSFLWAFDESLYASELFMRVMIATGLGGQMPALSGVRRIPYARQTESIIIA